MEEQRWREEPGGHVSEQDDSIEPVQPAGIVETREDERNQTKNVKMPGFLRRATAEIHEQANDQVPGSNQILVGHDRFAWKLLDHDIRDLELHTPALDQVIGLVPGPHCRQGLRHVKLVFYS